MHARPSLVPTLALLVGLAFTPWGAAQEPPPPEEIPQLPEYIASVVQQAAPGAVIDEWVQKEDLPDGGEEFRVWAGVEGEMIAFEIETDPAHLMRELEVKYELDPALRKIDHPETIPLAEVPPQVMAAALQAMPVFEVEVAYRGTIGVEQVYSLQGREGNFKVEYRVFASGKPLKIDKTRQVDETAPALVPPAP